jgi:hypothetical protein
VFKKISAENQSKKITLFFDVAKRPPFPQPPEIIVGRFLPEIEVGTISARDYLWQSLR